MVEHLRRYVGRVDEIIQPFAVVGFLSEHGQCLVEPVHQQAGFLHALHPAFDLLVAQRHLNIHILDQLVHAFKRPVKLGSNRLGEAFQHPHQGAIVLEEHQRVVITVFRLFLSGSTLLYIVDPTVSQDAPLCQKGDKSV